MRDVDERFQRATAAIKAGADRLQIQVPPLGLAILELEPLAVSRKNIGKGRRDE